MSAQSTGTFGGCPPYQLPPPRASAASLPLGTKPFLSYYAPAERSDSPSAPHSNDIRSSATRNEPLPSVSQLLTHTSSPSPPLHYPPPFEPSPPRDFPQPAHHHDHGLSIKLSRAFIFGDSTSPQKSRPRRQSGGSPLLSDAALQDSGAKSRPLSATNLSTLSWISHEGSHLYFSNEHHEGEQNTGISQSSNADSGLATGNHTQKKPPIRPHVVDERYIEGEGLCYIYADGSHCPKSIDGMPVNANWGITKAGKPRKRLAQACLTCREKKIKCQPNLPRCDQCQKSGRDCRFENAPRGHRAVKVSHQAGQTSRSDAKDSRSSFSNSHSVPPNPFHSVNRTSNSPTSVPSGPSPISESSIFTSSAPDGVHEGAPDGEIGHKAGLKGSNRSSLELPQHQVESIGSYASPDFAELLMEVKHLDRDDPLTCDWNTDPYEADPELTTHYIETYFNYVNDTLYYMLPRGRFFLWLNSSRTKSLADKMLLYSMMTLGSVFSNRPDKLTALKRYSRTARYAIEHSQHLFTLQLAQSRIILSLWYYAIGALVKSWDSIGGAVRTVCGLCYNIESGGVTAGQTQVCEYGLHPQALLECRRRTFWVAFLVERLTTLYAPSSVFIPSQTALLRLPCREDIYEAQEYGTVPYFQDFLNKEASSIKEGDVSGLSFMAFLISIVTLWSDVSQHIFYSPHIPADAYARIFKEFHTTIVWRAGEWTMKLPENLTFTTENLERSIRMRKGDAFISVHLLYHVTLMKLNRYVRYRNLPSGTVDQYIHNAQHHAAEILRICVSLARCTADHRSRPARSSHSEPFLSLKAAHLNPFLGYIILTAVDAVSAAGLMTDLRDCIALLQGGLDTIKELGHYWGSSLQLASHIEARIDLMADCLRHDTGKAGWILDGTPLHTRVRVGNAAQRQNPTGGAINQDLLYGGLPRERLFRALGLPGVSEDDILCISDGSHDSPVLSSNGLK